MRLRDERVAGLREEATLSHRINVTRSDVTW